MSPQDLLNQLFDLPQADNAHEMRPFLKRWGTGKSAASAFDRLVQVALRADRRANAAAAGHQAAIRRLFPTTPENAVTAFCVSEDQGPRPSKILTSLQEHDGALRLNGTKRWGSMSPNADILYVAASIGWHNGQNQLRMVRVAADSQGVTLDTAPYQERHAEMGIADIRLDNVAVLAGDVLPDDAYTAYIKPFRLIEDVYGTAATQVGLLHVAKAHAWPEETIENLIGLIMRAQSISETDMASASSVLLLASYLRESHAFWLGLETLWQSVPSDIRRHWAPETGLLEVAARAREIRRQNAWAELRG